jgi:hypothetical protein
MDTFELKDKDGTLYEVRAPSPELALSAFKKMQGMTAQQPAAPQVSSERQSVDAWRKENPIKAGVRDVARNVVRGLPFGSYLDEAAAGITALRRGTNYADEKRMVDAMDEAASDNSTKLGTLPLIGDVTAGGLTSLASGIATAPLAPVARVMQGATLLPRAVNLGLTGSGYGALYGAGEGNTTGERLGNMLLGGGLGAGLGAAAPVVGAGVSNAARGVADRMRPAPRELQNYSRPAINRMAELLQMDNLNQQQIAGQANRLGREGMLADMGENMRTATEALNQQPGPARQDISRVLRARRDMAQSRINADVDQALGPAANVPATIEQTAQHYRAAQRPLYDAFYETEVPQTAQLRQVIGQIQNSAPGAFRKAQQMAIAEGVNPQYLARLQADPMGAMTGNQGRTVRGQRQWTPVELDYLKRAVDDVARNAAPGSNEARIFGGLARNLRNTVDESLSPGDAADSPWAQARQVAGEGINIRDAVDEGQRAFSKGLSADQLAADMARRSDMGRAGYRIGARENLRSMMSHAGTAFRGSGDVKARQLLNSPEARRKVELLAENPQNARNLNQRIGTENTFAETYEQAMGNSATARRQAARDLIPRQYDAKNMSQLRQTSLSGFAMEGVGRIANALSGRYLNERNQRIAQEMAQMLIAQGVSRNNVARGLVDMANRANVSAQARQNINRFAENLVRGSTAPAISSSNQ